MQTGPDHPDLSIDPCIYASMHPCIRASGRSMGHDGHHNLEGGWTPCLSFEAAVKVDVVIDIVRPSAESGKVWEARNGREVDGDGARESRGR